MTDMMEEYDKMVNKQQSAYTQQQNFVGNATPNPANDPFVQQVKAGNFSSIVGGNVQGGPPAYKPSNDANIWGSLYQTSNDLGKMEKFDKDVKLYDATDPSKITEHTQNMINNLDVLGEVYGQDTFGGRNIDIEKLENMVYKTGLHESIGGQLTTQLGGGPARGYHQIEPKTARDMFANFSRLGPSAMNVINNALSEAGYSNSYATRQDAANMSDAEIEAILMNPRASTMLAGTKYLQSSMSPNIGGNPNPNQGYFLK